MTAPPLAEPHYQLVCYVCGPAETLPTPFEGWATFAQIYQQRPSRCRFAVVRMVPVFEKPPAGDYLVWDLDTLRFGKRLRDRGLLPAPAAKWRGASVDGLIMKAMALYDR